jgi:hypothetical protein
MLITVTEKHIQDGIREDCNSCAIALALRDAGGFTSVHVYEARKLECDGFRYTVCPLNYSHKEINTWIDQFDSGIHVQPIEFEIEPVDEDPTPQSRPVE